RAESRTERIALDTGHSVRIEDPFDVRPSALDLGVEALAQPCVAAAHAHRDVEYEGEERRIDLRRDRRDLEVFREVSGLRTPDDRDVDVALRHGVDDLLRAVAGDR